MKTEELQKLTLELQRLQKSLQTVQQRSQRKALYTQAWLLFKKVYEGEKAND